MEKNESGKCESFIPEENNVYPLCVNEKCERYETCCISVGLDEPPFER